jgi:hypothetical protein
MMINFVFRVHPGDGVPRMVRRRSLCVLVVALDDTRSILQKATKTSAFLVRKEHFQKLWEPKRRTHVYFVLLGLCKANPAKHIVCAAFLEQNKISQVKVLAANARKIRLPTTLPGRRVQVVHMVVLHQRVRQFAVCVLLDDTKLALKILFTPVKFVPGGKVLRKKQMNVSFVMRGGIKQLRKNQCAMLALQASTMMKKVQRCRATARPVQRDAKDPRQVHRH